MMAKAERKLTGWHVLAIFGGCFAVIIGVNLWLVFSAVKSFPGLDVDNSYVASQEFDAQKQAQDLLGWQTDVLYDNGAVRLILNDRDGNPVTPNEVSVKIGRATTAKYDQELSLRFDGEAFSAPIDLSAGKWLVFVNAIAADGTAFYQVQELRLEK